MFDLHDIILPRGSDQSYLVERGTHGLGVSIAFTALATLFVSARLYTRLKILGRMQWNDYMILLALVSA